MVKHTLKTLQQMLQDLSVFDHFGVLFIKQLTIIVVNSFTIDFLYFLNWDFLLFDLLNLLMLLYWSISRFIS